jgi:hypothetical protein
MDMIRQRLIQVIRLRPWPVRGDTSITRDNDKLLAKLDWNITESNTFTLRYNYLNARRDLGPASDRAQLREHGPGA